MIKPADTPRAYLLQRAPVKLLDRESPPAYISEWTAHVATQNNTVEPGTQSVVIFRIDKEWLALPTNSIQEVIDRYTIRTLPDRRREIVKGLINVRGELVLCIALEFVLGMGTIQGRRSPKDRLLIFRRGRFAVQVDEVFGVYRYHPDDLRPAPATLRRRSSGSFTIGILRWQAKAVACLDEELLFCALNKGLE